MKRAVILFGPPGAGKGTQAEMLAGTFGFLHVETSRLLEEAFRTHPSEETIIQERSFTYAQEKENFDNGVLVEPEVVVHLMREAIRLYAQEGHSLLFSGSPRTHFESEQLFPVFCESFGQDGIFCFFLSVPQELCVMRNLNRRICVSCRLPHEPDTAVMVCLRCGGKLVKRGKLDSEESLKRRWREFEERTLPGIEYFRAQGVPFFEIDGARRPAEVFSDIRQLLQIP